MISPEVWLNGTHPSSSKNTLTSPQVNSINHRFSLEKKTCLKKLNNTISSPAMHFSILNG